MLEIAGRGSPEQKLKSAREEYAEKAVVTVISPSWALLIEAHAPEHVMGM